MREPLKWYDANEDNPPWIKALAEVRHLATREGWCYHHVQAIIVSIDQYAESALGNLEYFLNRCNRLVLPGLSNAADHMPSKPDPPTAPVPVGNLIWLAVDRESGDAVVQ